MMSYGTFTLKEMAGLLVASGVPGAGARVMRQIRHWTNEDILATVGGKHTGTGVSRRYNRYNLEKAAVLLEAARYGMTVPLLRHVGEWLDDLARDDDIFAEARNGARNVYLEQAWRDDGAAWFGRSHDAPRGVGVETPRARKKRLGKPTEASADSCFRSQIVINLSTLLYPLAVVLDAGTDETRAVD